jgi:hypothetical protein
MVVPMLLAAELRFTACASRALSVYNGDSLETRDQKRASVSTGTSQVQSAYE